ncbi:MAG TPA: TonB-dependent receptor, partial [Candidatus Competibacter sp.]|nr:TonB-dependent receptor [Candidatus Competibacter sp.]
ATKVAEKARQRAPNDALVHSTWGFLQLAHGRTSEADQAFRDAIAQDSTLGEPHLGLGIALFKRNRTGDAIDEIRKATLLEPKVSLYNSYLGKAYYEIKDDRLAQKYLDAAKQLDPRDPTPHFYDAIREQSINQPVEAVRDLQKSIDLNDNRAVYRSKLLLDEDLAARDAALGKLYNELGFEQLGLNEGRKSLASDPANHSAHRLLADSYSAVPGVEAARTSELLQAQLLQPINITPVSPQMAETKLLLPSAGPITPSLYEFNPLFVQNRPTLFVSGLGGNQGTWGDEVIVSGLTDRVAYSFGQFHYQSDGYRPNNDLENNLYNLFVQTAVTPDFSLQAEYRYRETISGYLESNFDGSFSASRRRNLDQDTARIGARYSLSPQTTAIASIIYTDREGVISSKASDFRLAGKSRGTQAEAQLLYKAEPFNVITGLGGYSFDFSFSDSDSPSGEPDANITQQIAYGYANIKIPDNVIWTIGLSYQSDDNTTANLNELNPKFGVQWAITDRVSLRAAAFKASDYP